MYVENLTVVPSDKLIIMEGKSVVLDSGVTLNPSHKGLHALQWHLEKGELEWENGNPNTYFSMEEFSDNCQTYIAQFNEEIERKEKEQEKYEEDYKLWYNSLEQRWMRLRHKRDTLISDTDYLLMSDYPITEECKQEFQNYRQALRDITSLEGAPWNDDTIPWPKKPDISKIEE